MMHALDEREDSSVQGNGIRARNQQKNRILIGGMTMRVDTRLSRYGDRIGKKWVCIFVIIILLALVAPSAADIGPNSMGYKTFVIEQCYYIDNADEYPGYVFGVAPWPEQSGGFLSFDDKRCFKVEEYTHMSQIYAIQKTDYNLLKKEKPYLIPYSTGIPSGYPAPLQAFGVEPSFAADNQTDNLTIVSLNNSGLVLDITRSYATFSKGIIYEVPKYRPTFPVITPTSTPLPVHVVLASVVLALGLVVMIGNKKKEKRLR